MIGRTIYRCTGPSQIRSVTSESSCFMLTAIKARCPQTFGQQWKVFFCSAKPLPSVLMHRGQSICRSLSLPGARSDRCFDGIQRAVSTVKVDREEIGCDVAALAFITEARRMGWSCRVEFNGPLYMEWTVWSKLNLLLNPQNYYTEPMQTAVLLFLAKSQMNWDYLITSYCWGGYYIGGLWSLIIHLSNCRLQPWHC